MNSFSITFNSAVQGFWGWWILVALVVVTASMFATSIGVYRARGQFSGASEGFLTVGIILGFLCVFGSVGISAAQGDAETQTYNERRQAALTEAGYPLAMYSGEQIMLKDDEGETALYVSVEETDGDDHQITYYQISE